jgi:hypothetical protein
MNIFSDLSPVDHRRETNLATLPHSHCMPRALAWGVQ